MKKILSLLTILCLLCGALLTVSCGDPEAPAGTVTRVTVDINPSIELLLDEQGRVVSAVALNDDGAIVIAGETFVGKTAEEALVLTLTIASETGYLVRGNAENTLKLSVSGDSKFAKSLTKNLEKKAKSLFKSLDIKGAIEFVEELKTDELRSLVAKSSLHSGEELAKMTSSELYRALSEGRDETALILTEELRQAFLVEKEYKIALAKKEAVAAIIEELGGAYLVTHATYQAALDAYRAAVNSLESFRYETILSPDSSYQTALTALREAKTELLKQRTYTASLKVDDVKYAEATLTLALSEEAYEAALSAFEALGDAANETIDTLIAAISSAEKGLRELEDTIFNDTLKKTLSERALEIEAAIFKAKAEFFLEFEETHGEDARAIKEALISKKNELKESVSSQK